MNSKLVKTVGCALSVFLSALFLSAEGRTMTVSLGEGDIGGRVKTAKLTFSVGRSGTLYCAYGTKDGGDDPAAWEHLEKVADVSPMTTEMTCDFPATINVRDGFARFFLMDKPIEAVQRDYLDFDGQSYIHTDFNPNASMTIEMNVELATVEESFCLFSTRWGSSDPTRIVLFYLAGSGWRFDYGATGSGVSPAVADTPYNIVANGTGLYVNETLVSARSPLTFNCVESLAIFVTRESTAMVYPGKGRLYSCRVWGADQTLLHDLVPAATNGVACLYDAAKNKYYGNSGTGTLTCGPGKTETTIFCQSTTLEGRFGAGRSFTILSAERDERKRLKKVRFEIQPGAARWLCAGIGAMDAGDDLDAWGSVREIVELRASATNEMYEFAVPADWPRATRVARFFLTNLDNLPGVDRLTSVKVEGGQYVQTDFVPNQDSAIEMDVTLATADENLTLFCARGMGTQENTCTLFYIAATGWRYDFNKWQHVSLVRARAGERCRIKAGTYSLDVNDNSVFPAAEPPSGFVADGKFALFASHLKQTGYGNFFKGEFHSLRAWEKANDPTTKRLDLVPCLMNGVACLYNKVDGRYLMGSGGLKAGEREDERRIVWSAETMVVNPECGLRMIVQ